jgi:hypothetical protein
MLKIGKDVSGMSAAFERMGAARRPATLHIAG